MPSSPPAGCAAGLVRVRVTVRRVRVRVRRVRVRVRRIRGRVRSVRFKVGARVWDSD